MNHGRAPLVADVQDAFTASADDPSPFGFLFTRDRTQPTPDAMTALAAIMDDTAPPTENSTQPAGFTFFGQFVDHDITLSLGVPGEPREPFDFAATRNGRTPRLDLDSVFGGGPAFTDSKHLYDQASLRLLLGEAGFGVPAPNGPDSRLLGDPRNGENLIILQLHTVFMRLYNRFLGQTPGPAGDLFRYEAARRKVVLHYQNIVLNDYLPRIVGRAAIEAALQRNVPWYRRMTKRVGQPLVMPAEFAFAAFRFGHSQVRAGYAIQLDPNGTPRGRGTFVDAAGAPDLNGNQAVTDDVVINWDFFFELSELDGGATALPRNFSRRFDTKLAAPLFLLEEPGIPARTERSLAARNLLRGGNAGLPSGQAVARTLGIVPLRTDQLGLERIADDSLRSQIEAETPLWYYVLREAEVVGGGTQLVGVGAFILAETFVGLLSADEHSILNVDFRPDPGLETLAGICAYAWPNRGRGLNPAPTP